MRFTVIITAAAIVASFGCAPGEPEPSAEMEAAAPTVIGSVEASNYPLSWVVERLAAPLVEVRFRAAGAADPAYWDPSAEDVLAMQQADLIVLNGASYERWLKKVSLPASRLVDTTAHVAERLISVAETVTHSHGPEGEHEHTGTAFTTWLDPSLLAEQAMAVRMALGARWPEHDALFADRLAALTADLEALDAELATATAGAGDRQLLFSHPVYQYFQERYGLTGTSLHWEPDLMPDDAQWADLDHLLHHHRAELMVWEAEPLDAVREELANRGVGVVVFSPCATPPAEGDYLGVMRRNAVKLRDAFEGRP
jgi:zinc transport system substrate-binding protein